MFNTAPPNLTPEDFIYWLEDFLELVGDDGGIDVADLQTLISQHHGVLTALQQNPKGQDEPPNYLRI